MNKNIFTLIFLFGLYGFIFSNHSQAQVYSKCGTIIPPALVAIEKANFSTVQNKSLFVPNRCFGKTLSITAHIISDSLGNYNLSPAAINGAIQDLNNKFAPICVSFEVCNVLYIPNYKYDNFLKTTEEDELINLYNVPKTINMYFVKEVMTAPGNVVGGYAYFPGGRDFIMITKSQLGVIPHEMGHFFGLFHTFENSIGLELVNGSNCLTAGDLICDTPADPGLSNFPAPNCNMSPGATDPNGNWYTPDVGNIMSYYSSDCQCGFTTQQYNRMALQYFTNRFYLW